MADYTEEQRVRLAIGNAIALVSRFVAIFLVYIVICSSSKGFDGIGLGGLLTALFWQAANIAERWATSS